MLNAIITDRRDIITDRRDIITVRRDISLVQENEREDILERSPEVCANEQVFDTFDEKRKRIQAVEEEEYGNIGPHGRSPLGRLGASSDSAVHAMLYEGGDIGDEPHTAPDGRELYRLANYLHEDSVSAPFRGRSQVSSQGSRSRELTPEKRELYETNERETMPLQAYSSQGRRSRTPEKRAYRPAGGSRRSASPPPETKRRMTPQGDVGMERGASSTFEDFDVDDQVELIFKLADDYRAEGLAITKGDPKAPHGLDEGLVEMADRIRNLLDRRSKEAQTREGKGTELGSALQDFETLLKTPYLLQDALTSPRQTKNTRDKSPDREIGQYSLSTKPLGELLNRIKEEKHKEEARWEVRYREQLQEAKSACGTLMSLAERSIVEKNYILSSSQSLTNDMKELIRS